ncbi:MAG TPA: heavy metal-associated domain-containing protein [Bryobacteraceae bacterium]|jgi:copper chaperone CopZ|nr:heavy metal-associated domain-containing protein [Bryobacteraceae bacterium]
MTCAYAVRVALMKFPGVESADVSLNKGLATVKLKPGNTVRPVQFWESIRKNGNTPKTTRVLVRGEILGNGDQLRVSGSQEMFRLKAGPEVIQQLKASTGKTVTVAGALTPEKELKTAVPLEVQAIRQ